MNYNFKLPALNWISSKYKTIFTDMSRIFDERLCGHNIWYLWTLFYQEIQLFSQAVTNLVTRSNFERFCGKCSVKTPKLAQMLKCILFMKFHSNMLMVKKKNILSVISELKRSNLLSCWHLVMHFSFFRSGFLVSPSMTKSQPSSITTPLQRIPPSLNIQTLLLVGP